MLCMYFNMHNYIIHINSLPSPDYPSQQIPMKPFLKRTAISSIVALIVTKNTQSLLFGKKVQVMNAKKHVVRFDVIPT